MYIDDRQLEDLKSLVGKFVRVAITEDGYTRCHFGPQLAVGGVLEEHHDKPGHYRVLVNDDTFTYFTPDNVVLVNLLTSKPTIMLKIDVEVAKPEGS